jgi:hypothetical protein
LLLELSSSFHNAIVVEAGEDPFTPLSGVSAHEPSDGPIQLHTATPAHSQRQAFKPHFVFRAFGIAHWIIDLQLHSLGIGPDV